MDALYLGCCVVFGALFKYSQIDNYGEMVENGDVAHHHVFVRNGGK